MKGRKSAFTQKSGQSQRGYSKFAFTEEGYVAFSNGYTRDFNWIYYETESKAYTWGGPINKICEYGYIYDDSHTKGTVYEENQGSFYDSIIRGTAAYKLNDGEIYKCSFLDDSVTKLDLGAYRITDILMTPDRRIEITGLNENLDTIKGYLDLNDQISFGEPKSKGIIILTPIN